MEAGDSEAMENAEWFYEAGGQRKGPVSQSEIQKMIEEGLLTDGSIIWKKGMQDWTLVRDTELRKFLRSDVPPPLTGENVNNSMVWILAFAPIIGRYLESFVAQAIYGDNVFATVYGLATQPFFLISVALNIALSYLDERKLRGAGCDTSRFNGAVWLVPVYLYQRAKALKQNMAYFIVWLVCFAAVVLRIL